MHQKLRRMDLSQQICKVKEGNLLMAKIDFVWVLAANNLQPFV